jgi:metal-responsive CopG/Arc/MetJ family transcriptional regulator
MIKVTFTLDDETVARLRRAATRLAKPQSQVVREAIRDYEARNDKLSDEERTRMLEVLDRVLPAVRARPKADVEAEIKEVRQVRRLSSRHRAQKAGE